MRVIVTTNFDRLLETALSEAGVERHGVVFANFGSTEEVPIWEDPSALIHWQLHRCSDAEEEALVRLVLRKCREAGAEVRVSFYDQRFE